MSFLRACQQQQHLQADLYSAQSPAIFDDMTAYLPKQSDPWLKNKQTETWFRREESGVREGACS